MSYKKTIKQSHSVSINHDIPPKEEDATEDLALYSVDSDITEEMEGLAEETETDAELSNKPSRASGPKEIETTRESKEPEPSTDENIIENALETDNFTALLNDDYSAQNEHDSMPETDPLTDELTRDEQAVRESTDRLEDDTELLGQPLEDLPFEKLIETDSTTDSFTALLGDDGSVQDGLDIELETNPLADELTQDVQAETESTKQFADDTVFQGQPLEDLPFDKLIETDSTADSFTALLGDDGSVQDGLDIELETNPLADELTQEVQAEIESTKHFADDTVFQGQPLEDLPFEKLIETDSTTDSFTVLLGDDGSSIQDGLDIELETDPLSDELTQNAQAETDNTEQFADNTDLQGQSLEDLPFDKLIETDSTTDSFADLHGDDGSVQERHDSEPETDPLTERLAQDLQLDAEIAEQYDNNTDFHGQLIEDLQFDQLIDTESATDNFATLLDDIPAGKSELDPSVTSPLISEKTDTNQSASATDNSLVAHTQTDYSASTGKIYGKMPTPDVVEQAIPVQPSDKQSHMKYEELSAVSEIEAPSSTPETRKFVSDSRQSPHKMNFIVLAVLVVLGSATAIWYGYGSIDQKTQFIEQRQVAQRNQQNSNNLNLQTKQEIAKTAQPGIVLPDAVIPGKDLLYESNIQIEAQTINNAEELFLLTKATKQLEKRLASVEEKLVGYDGEGRITLVTELGKQLNLLDQIVQDSIRTNQGLTGDITLQLKRLDTGIEQLENQVGQLQLQQASMQNSISSFEHRAVTMSSEIAAIQSDTTLKETQIHTKPADSRSLIGEDVPVRREQPNSTETVTPGQPHWAVNLSSYKKRASAEIEQIRLNASGMETIIRKAQVRGTTWFRVRIEGFSSKVAAYNYIKIKLNHNTFKDAWVSKSDF